MATLRHFHFSSPTKSINKPGHSIWTPHHRSIFEGFILYSSQYFLIEGNFSARGIFFCFVNINIRAMVLE